MKTSELIENSIKIPVKELASDMHLSKEQIYKWRSGEQRNPIDRAEAIIKASEDNLIIRYLCRKSGGYFIEMPEVSESSSEICANACKEFGELLTAMSTALADGIIDKVEFERIDKEWGDLQNVMHGFLREQLNNIS